LIFLWLLQKQNPYKFCPTPSATQNFGTLRLNVSVSGYKLTKYAYRYRPSSYVVIETDSDVRYKQRRVIEFLSAENKSLENVHKRLERYGEDSEWKHC
jgi:hypothetical protein